VKVTDAMPLAFVVVLADEAPFRRAPVQSLPAGAPIAFNVNLTVSPATTTGVAFITVVDAAAVLEPSAGSVAGTKVTVATVYGVAAGAGNVVWSMVALLLPAGPAGVPVPLSAAVTLQKPEVVEEM
jgi:hypothetical protein